jgi:8-oxo-dGTP diphosphatase
MVTNKEPMTPKLTVDAVVFHAPSQSVLLIKRKDKPFKGKWALPGGFVRRGETLEDTLRRIIKEEIGLEMNVPYDAIVDTYDDPQRDPRGHNVSIAFLFIIGDWFWDEENSPKPKITPIIDFAWKHFNDITIRMKDGEIAFDHKLIVMDAVNKAQAIIYRD